MLMKTRPFDPATLPAAPVQLIEASAGTGKTYSITTLYLRFILEDELGVEQILVLSFTEAATAELHSRLRARLQAAVAAWRRGGDDHDPFLDHLVRQSRQPARDLLLLQRAVSEIDQAAVTTIHSFCHRVLQQGAFESGMPFELELAGSIEEFHEELLYDYLATRFHQDDPRLLALLRREYGRKELIGLLREALRHRYFPLLTGAEPEQATFSTAGTTVAEPVEPAEPVESVEPAKPSELPESPEPSANVAGPPHAQWRQSLAAVQQHFARARQSWHQDEAAIVQELQSAGFMKPFRDLLATGLAGKLAAYLAPVEPASLLVPAGSDKLTPCLFNDPAGKVCMKKAIKEGRVPKQQFFADWQKYLDQVEQLAGDYRSAAVGGLLEFARRELPRRLAAAGLLSFDDLLYNLRQALVGPGGETLRRFIAARYPVALIDEFQDTDPVQYEILQTVYRPAQKHPAAGKTPSQPQNSGDDARPLRSPAARRLILIGDPKQAIYAFRGADIFAYLKAAADSGDQRYTMTVNWRADRRMVAAVNALFQGVAQPFVVAGIDFPAVAARPEAPDLWRELADQRELPDQGGQPETSDQQLPAERSLWEPVVDGRIRTAPLQFILPPAELVDRVTGSCKGLPAKGPVEKVVPGLVAGDIAELLAGRGRLGEKPLRPADIAVLVRSNEQAARIQQALQQRGIAAVLHSRDTVLQSSEARHLAVLLHALLEQAGEARRRAALLTPLLGGSPAELEELADDEQKWQVWLLRFERWSRLWRERGFMAAMRALGEECGIAPRLLAYPDGQRRLTNFRHLVELLHGRAREAHLQPQALLNWLEEGIVGLRAGVEAEELRLESDEEAVQVLTIHRSKGLEFPVVYCPYLWRTGKRHNENQDKFFTFHDPEDDWQGQITLRPDGPQRQARRRELFAEDLRLLYVALTRAKHCCRVVWFAASGYEESALAYLLHGGEEGRPPTGLAGLAWAELAELLKQRTTTEPDWGLLTAPCGRLAAGGGAESAPPSKVNGRSNRQPAGSAEQLSATEPDRDGPHGESQPAALHAPRPQVEPLANLPNRVRQVSKSITGAWRVGSFSQLTAKSMEIAMAGGERDYDGGAAGGEIVAAAGAAAGSMTSATISSQGDRFGISLPPNHEVAAALPIEATNLLKARIPLADLPAGAGIGNLWHRILELISFNKPEQHQEVIAEQLRIFGLDREQWQTPLAEALAAMLATPLTADQSFRLADLDDTMRLNEMAFTCPVRQADRPLEPSRLAQLFRDFPAGLPPDYPQRLEQLRFPAIQGYLKGFIDLVCCWQGRWYVIDYKSNLLGSTHADYTPHQLAPVMAEHHYLLQYHLYALALHRHLTRRLPDYDYHRHFGGAIYLFLRGLHPNLGPAAGIYAERPPIDRIAALSELLGPT